MAIVIESQVLADRARAEAAADRAEAAIVDIPQLIDKYVQYQIYPNPDYILGFSQGVYIEEDAENEKVFFKLFDVNVRITDVITRTRAELATELNITLVTSTLGVTECVEIPSNSIFLYDTNVNKFKIIERDSIEDIVHLPVLSNIQGRIYSADIWYPFLIESERRSAVGGIGENNHYQFYGNGASNYNNSEIFIQEGRNATVPDTNVYFKCFNLFGRVGISKTVDFTELRTELGGLSLVTAPNGETNVIAIPTLKTMVYNKDTNQYGLIDRDDINTLTEIPLLSNVEGRVVAPSALFPHVHMYETRTLAKIFSEQGNVENGFQFYGVTSSVVEGFKEVYIEENTGSSNSIFFKVSSINVRIGAVQTRSNSALATELGVSLTTSTQGKSNCIELPSLSSLVYDTSSNSFKIVVRDNIVNLYQIVLLSCVDGRVVHPSLLEGKLLRGLIDNIDSGGFPSYYTGEADKTAREAHTDQTTKDVLTLVTIADTHDYPNHCREAKNMTERVSTDALIHLGDWIYDKDDVNDATESLREQVAELVKAQVPKFFLKGNHDFNTNYFGDPEFRDIDNQISDSLWYAIAARYGFKDFIGDDSNDTPSYGYLDFDESKIRLICLNTSDIPIDIPDSGDPTKSKYAGVSVYGFQNAQLNWLANEALDLSSKSTPSDWGVVICSHVPLYDDMFSPYTLTGTLGATLYNYTPMADILNAYRRGISVSGSNTGDFAYSISKDFSSQGAMEIYCCLSGHLHVDGQNYLDFGDGDASEVLCISILNSIASDTNASPGAYSPQAPSRTANTFSSNAFDVVTINPVDRTVDLRRFGASSEVGDADRSFSFDA